ncbi:MAG: TonB-dependent receptor [Candidatus Omnitrophica bacterium]|nr:TonB-dependent receptor [Candidatus Omnitrophota bacterium]
MDRFSKYKVLTVLGLLLVSLSPAAWAQAPVTTMEEVTVVAKKEEDRGKGVQPLAEVEGAKIYSGKKTSWVDVKEAPAIVNSNYRQVFEKTPGLLLSEESTPLFSLGYRGLNPDRAQFMQVMKDGIPIAADLFGYPESYYTPPTQVVDHIDFIRGGSALMYGPQPGGAINFVTKDPYPDAPFALLSEDSAGSHGFYSNYTSLSGTQGAFGYYGYFHHRRSQGFRDFNSQYEVYYGGAKFTVDQDPTARWIFAFDVYEETHGEPGGLTRFDFDNDPSRSTRLMDHFELNRYAGSLTFEKDLSENTYLELKGFGGAYERLSWRQRGGGFGTIPTGSGASTNEIQKQEFNTGGADLRLRHDYAALGSDGHAVTAGVFYYHSTSPRNEQRGTTGDALDGTVRKDSDRETDYMAVFLENLFKFGKFSVTPGIRFENIWQSIKESMNLDKTTAPLGDESDHDFVTLAGVGAAYELAPETQVYANYSESYRPKLYAEGVPLGTNQVINQDLEEGNAWQVDLGFRGNPVPYLSWDASVFYMAFDGQTGTVGNTIQNVGDAEYPGVELAAELDVVGWWDAIRKTTCAEKIGSMSVFYNATLLDAEFTGGPVTGKIPQYAPDYLMRGGVEYRWKDKAKVRLGGTFVDDHFGDDSNTTQRILPSYKVWDLTAEMKVYKDIVSLFGGINNLFDEHYFSRVTSAGIDPADGRNYYGGVKFRW